MKSRRLDKPKTPKKTPKDQPKRKRGRPVTPWNDEYYVILYDLAKQGLSLRKMAESLGISHIRLSAWIEEKPALRATLERARGHVGKGVPKTETFFEYVYKQLPEHLQSLWDELEKFWDSETNDVAAVDSLLRDQGTRTRQHLFLHAMVMSNFNPSEACRKLNMKAHEFRTWIKTDPDFAELIEELRWHKGNFFEAGLTGLVKQGDSAATIFANKTFNRDRGYDSRTTVEVTGGTINAQINLDEVPLTLEQKRELLQALRNKNKEVLGLPAPAEKDTVDAEVEEAEDDTW